MAQNMPPPSYSVDEVYALLLVDRFEQKVCSDYLGRLEKRIHNREKLLADTLVSRNAIRISSMCNRGMYIVLIYIVHILLFK